MNPEVKKWRVAHPQLDDVPDIALETVAPFPSLYANDFVGYLSSKGNGDEIITFVRDLSRELVWVYGMLYKAQRDNDLPRVFAEMLDGCTYPAEYQLTHQYIRDWAKAHGIHLPSNASNEPAWHGVFLAGGETTQNDARS